MVWAQTAREEVSCLQGPPKATLVLSLSQPLLLCEAGPVTAVPRVEAGWPQQPDTFLCARTIIEVRLEPLKPVLSQRPVFSELSDSLSSDSTHIWPLHSVLCGWSLFSARSSFLP